MQDLKTNIWAEEDENGECSSLHIEELHSLYRSPSTVKVIKSKRLRWTGHITTMEKCGSTFKFLKHKPIGKKAFRKALFSLKNLDIFF